MSMYELWLGLNIVWELGLANLGVIFGLAGAWLLVVALALHRRPLHRSWAAWRLAWPTAILLAVALGAAAFIALPTLTQSDFRAMGYWLDWATLVCLAAASAGLCFAFLWPLLAMRRNH